MLFAPLRGFLAPLLCGTLLLLASLFAKTPSLSLGPEIPPRKPRSSFSLGFDRPGAYPLFRCRGSTTDSLCRFPWSVPPRRISSSSCCGMAHDSLLPCSRSQGSGNTDLFPFFGVPCSRPNLS